MAGSRYSPGTRAWGLCKKCGLRFLLRDLVFDGYYPGLRVCQGCYDPQQPQEFLVDVTDPEALWKPSPEDGPTPSVLTGYGLSNEIFLNWTEVILRGQPRVESYQVWRAVSTDGGASFSAPIELAEFPIHYYGDPGAQSLADLVERGNPSRNDNEGIDTGLTLSYADVVGTALSPIYRYQVIAQLSFHVGDSYQSVPSNTLDMQVSDWHALGSLAGLNDLTAGTLISTIVFTSRPYPIDVVESMNSSGLAVHTSAYDTGLFESFNAGNDFTVGTLINALHIYNNGIFESLNGANDFTAGTLQSALHTYTNGIFESLNGANDFTAGTLQVALLTYSNALFESLNASNDFIAGTLV